jgi:hypothetical protein
VIPSWRHQLANRILRCYPRRWRQRYENEVRDVVSASPLRWRDLGDLARSAAGEWEREMSRGPFGPLKVIPLAYVLLMAVYGLSVTILGGLQHGYSWLDFEVDSHLLEAIVGYPAMGAMFLTAGLVVNSPWLLALRLARRWLSVGLGRSVVAIGLALWAVWTIYRVDWYDIWRHGVPGLWYWVGFVPFALSFASAGAIIGGALVRTDDDSARRAVR